MLHIQIRKNRADGSMTDPAPILPENLLIT